MRIVIDMQACQNDSRFRGIGRYSTGLITSLLEVAKEKHDFILLFNGLMTENLPELINYFSNYIETKKMHIWEGLGPVKTIQPENKNRKEISKTLREKYIEKLNPDVVIMTTFFEGFGDETILSIPSKRNYLTFVTCHDLIPLIQKQVYLDPHPYFKEYYLNQVKEFSTSDGFLAVSESSKSELEKYLSIKSNKIVNTLEGVEPIFKSTAPTTEKIEKILNTKLNKKKIILYSGASDERKNHLKLIKAFSLLDKKERQESILVFVGVLNEDHVQKFKNYAARCNINHDELIITKRITDDEMIDLYSYCYLFVFPSFHEGFGLPALEAMSCGAPVIVANKTSLPEVVGSSELTFDPYNAYEIKKMLEKFISNVTYRNDIASYCYKRSAEFSWEKSAAIALKFIESSPVKKKAISTNPIVDDTVHTIRQNKLTKNIETFEKDNLALTIIRNSRPHRKPRIYFDMSILITVDFLTGIQRVVHEIYQKLLKNYNNDFEIIPVKTVSGDENLAEVNTGSYARAAKFRLSKADFFDFRPGDIYLNIDLNHNIMFKHDFFRSIREKGCRTYFIVHDILPLTLGQSFFPGETTRVHYNWLKEAAFSDVLLCVSASVMNDINYYINTFEKTNSNLQLGWFHLGADFNKSGSGLFSLKNRTKFKNINFENPSFIMVGSVEPRKGHFDVIEAFTSLWDSGYKGSLIIVGGRSWKNDLVVELIRTSQYLNQFLFWLSDVDDTELSYLYNESTALIAGSIGEGFGLPIIEAMQNKIDVITRDIPVFREVTHNKATYFKNTEELSNIILNYKINNTFKEKKYYLTWEESTDRLMDIIISNKFPIQWKRDKNLTILPVCSDIFNTTVGIKELDRIKTNRKSGLLVWGGYFPLTQGKYELTISGKSFINQTIDIAIAVHNDGVTNILFEQNDVILELSRSPYDSPEFLAHLDISMPLNADNTELYIRVKETNDLYISNFELKKISNKALPMITVSSGKLGTDVGLLVNNSRIESQHKAGLLVHGGYFKLEKGDYHLFIKGISQKKQTIDILIVCFKEGIKNIVFEKNNIPLDTTLVPQNNIDILATIDISIMEDISDAQIYLMVSEKNDLIINGFYFEE